MIIPNSVQTEHEVLKNVTHSVMKDMGIKKELYYKASNYSCVRKKVSDIMLQKLRGRVTLLKKSKISPRKMKTSEDKYLFMGCYPTSLITDKQKLKWLKDRLTTDEINYKVYTELVEVLDVSEEDMLKIDINLNFV